MNKSGRANEKSIASLTEDMQISSIQKYLVGSESASTRTYSYDKDLNSSKKKGQRSIQRTHVDSTKAHRTAFQNHSFLQRSSNQIHILKDSSLKSENPLEIIKSSPIVPVRKLNTYQYANNLSKGNSGFASNISYLSRNNGSASYKSSHVKGQDKRCHVSATRIQKIKQMKEMYMKDK